VQHLPPPAQTLELDLGIDELALRGDLLLDQDTDAAQLRFRS
jgi:hypothetical protein